MLTLILNKVGSNRKRIGINVYNLHAVQPSKNTTIFDPQIKNVLKKKKKNSEFFLPERFGGGKSVFR